MFIDATQRFGEAVVDLAITVDDGESADTLAELQDWLRQEPELRGRVAPVEHPPRPGELGFMTELLSVAVSGGGAVTALAAALRAFFAHARRPDLRITIASPDGHKIQIDARRVSDIETLLRSALDIQKR